nr:protein phosphatase 2C domain-containing protein [Streptomyces sp. RPA4-2]QIY65853.1 protein phosphatase 2C domain-containing protein [Streptomyces sp. RPA4-2]
MRLVTRGEGPGGEPDDAAIGVALTGLLSRLGDSLQREHVAFGIGDGALMVLRDGVWTGVFTPGETAAERGLRLPAAAQQVRCARLTTRPGDLPALCSSSLADLLVRPEVGDWFAGRWAGRQPHLTSFLSEVNVPVRSPGGDRTVVCLWDFGDARETPPAES